MRPDRFGFFKAAHRFFKPGQDRVRHAPGIQLRLRFAFMENPQIVQSLVSVVQRAKGAFGFRVTIGGVALELICDREAKQTQCGLIVGLDGQYVPADRFRFARFI